MQTKTYELVTIPGGAPEDMAAMIEDAYLEANINGGRVLAVHSCDHGVPLTETFGDATRSSIRWQSLFVVVEYPLDDDALKRAVSSADSLAE